MNATCCKMPGEHSMYSIQLPAYLIITMVTSPSNASATLVASGECVLRLFELA